MQVKVFDAALVRRQFSASFLDEAQCRRWVLGTLHPEGPSCPRCKAVINDEGRLRRFWSNQRIECPSCGKFFSALTGTFLKASHLDFRQIVAMALFLDLGLPLKEIAHIIGQDRETVRLWQRKFNVFARLRELEEDRPRDQASPITEADNRSLNVPQNNYRRIAQMDQEGFLTIEQAAKYLNMKVKILYAKGPGHPALQSRSACPIPERGDRPLDGR